MDCQRPLFRLDPDVHYLNCAYMAPMLQTVEDAGCEGVRRRRTPSGIGADDFFREGEELRALFARLLSSEPERVAIMPSASYGIASVARNLPLEADQTVVLLEEQFPSNVYSWARKAQDASARLTFVAPPTDEPRRGEAWNAAVLSAIDERTGIVALPHYHWSDGTRFDLVAIGERCRRVGAHLVIDGTQSIGAAAFDRDAVQPTAVICAAYKVLFGPYGLALAWMSSELDDGVPLEENWIARHRSEDFARLVDYEERYRPGAVRYDVGERSNPILLPMAVAALEQVLAWGVNSIQEYDRALTADTLQELVEAGFWIEDASWRAEHLFGIRPPSGTSKEEVVTALERHRVKVSVRGSAIRVSPHVYNDTDDLEALRQALLSCV